MSVLPPRNDRWSRFRAIARWCRRGAAPDPSELESRGQGEVTREVKEPVLTSELLSISGQGLYGSNLLERRMAALKLDPEELAQYEPRLVHVLQKICASCQTPMRCARDLAQELARDPAEPASSEWRDYCPNATTLNMLSVLKACSPPSEEAPNPPPASKVRRGWLTINK